MLAEMKCSCLGLLVIVVLGVVPCVGQIAPPTLKLKVRDEVAVRTQYATPVIFPARCDPEGNVYVRFYRYPDTLASPWVKVSPDGQVVATYSLTSIPEYNSQE